MPFNTNKKNNDVPKSFAERNEKMGAGVKG
jgi:hypothetical protein